MHLTRENWEQALTCFNRAIEINPKTAMAYSNRGNVFYNRRQYEQAMADYNRAVELSPQSANAYFNRGSVWLRLGNQTKAEEDFARAQTLKPALKDAAAAHLRAAKNSSLAVQQEKE